MNKITAVALVAATELFFGVAAYAGSSTLEGIVKNAQSQPMANAQIRIEGVEGPDLAKTTTTNANGKYSYGPLGTGTYKVTLVVNGTVKASIANVGMTEGEKTTLNFELRRSNAQPSAIGKHFVWVPGPTGTHTSGTWMEVDERQASRKVSAGEAMRMQTSAQTAVQRIQDSSSATRQ